MGLTGKIKCCIIVKKKLFNSDTRSNCEEIKVEAWAVCTNAGRKALFSLRAQRHLKKQFFVNRIQATFGSGILVQSIWLLIPHFKLSFASVKFCITPNRPSVPLCHDHIRPRKKKKNPWNQDSLFHDQVTDYKHPVRWHFAKERHKKTSRLSLGKDHLSITTSLKQSALLGWVSGKDHGFARVPTSSKQSPLAVSSSWTQTLVA